jgi:hypothetical protein
VDVGANSTLNVADWFGAIVAGAEKPLSENPVPESETALTDRFMFPLLLRVTLCVLDCPTVTLLKFSDEGENPATA